MRRRKAVGGTHGVARCLACALVALAMLAGCTGQQQATEAAQPAIESQEQSLQDDAGEAQSVRDDEELREANALAQERLAEGREVEPAITQTLQSFEDDSARLMGLEHRLKGEKSLARKIVSDAHTEEISLEEAADNISDVVRYTFAIDSPVYVSMTTEVLKSLEDMGYTVVKFKNYWADDLYKGLNTKLLTPDGYLFELQFHTPESLDVKERTHVYYEAARSEDATEEEVAEAERMERELIAGLEIPPGALEFAWE